MGVLLYLAVDVLDMPRRVVRGRYSGDSQHQEQHGGCSQELHVAAKKRSRAAATPRP